MRLDADQRRSTPYYVEVSVGNEGSTGPGTDDPDLTFQAIDDRGREQASITFMGEFPRRDDQEPPRPFARGKGYESCLTYLMPGGGSIDEVRWNDGPAKANENMPYFEKPVIWGPG